MLAGDAEHGTARHEHGQPRCGGEQLREETGRGEQLLEVVQHEQDLRVRERCRQRLVLRQQQRLRDRPLDERGILDRCERREDGPVGELLPVPARGLERETRLADPARPGQRDQPDVVAAQRRPQLVELRIAADERRGRDRERRAPPAHGRRAHRRLERGLLFEDRPLEPLQRRRRLDPELLDQRPPCAAIRLERVGLASGRVERAHQLAPQALAQGMLCDERLELGGALGVLARGEIGLDPVLERRESKILQPGRLRLGEPLGRELSQRLSAPELERLPEQRGRPLRLAGLQRGPSLVREPLEAARVDPLRVHPQLVAAASRDDRVAERLAEMRDEHVESAGRGVG